MLLIQVYAPLVVFGTEVRSVETEGTIGCQGQLRNVGLGVRMFFWTFFSNYIPVSSDIEEDLVLLKIT